MPRKNFVIFLVVLFALALGMSRAFSDDKYYHEMRTFTVILDHVSRNYVDELDAKKRKQLFETAYNGMLSQLDPYTQYFNVDETKSFSQDTEGKFGGLGIEISIKDGVLTVISPIRDTPAYKAGILAGDRILKIDGKSTERIGLGEAVQYLRGLAGTKVLLTIRHMGGIVDKEIELTRAIIKPAAVEYEIIDKESGVGFMRMTSFNAHVTNDMRTGLDKMTKEGGLKALILDLRGNPGGLLDKAVEICDEFIGEGVVVSVKGRHAVMNRVYRAKPGDAYERLPLVLLVDGGSASASEIVAGCMRDYKRAVLVGTRTYGKGSVQNIINLGNGEALKMTTARYYTPNDTPIKDREGIFPDIPVLMMREHMIALRNQEREDKERDRYHVGGALDEDEMPVQEKETEKPDPPKDTPENDNGQKRRPRVVDAQLKAALNILKWKLHSLD